MKNSKMWDTMVVGFALFAMFFGAGNLIFPPDLGLRGGNLWWLAFLFYFIADLGLGVLAVMGMIRMNGRAEECMKPLGRIPSVVITTALICCLGPGLAIPRTAATTFELGMIPLFGFQNGGMAGAVFSVIFFGIVLLLTVRPGKVVDIIGKILTPILLGALAVMIVKGVITPGAAVREAAVDNVVREGIINGYQTLDMVAAIFFSTIVMNSIRNKGYKEAAVIRGMTIKAALLAAGLLFFVYGGLAYLGASTGALFRDTVLSGDMNQAGFLTAINASLLGSAGTAVLAVVVSSACLTTAIGLVSAVAEYFEKLLKGRITYAWLALIICVFSAVVCNLGLSRIIALSAPVLMLLYPITIVMVLSVFLRDKVKSHVPYRAAGAVVLMISLLEMGADTFGNGICQKLISMLPLNACGFGWLIPGAVIFTLAASAAAVGDEMGFFEEKGSPEMTKGKTAA